MSAAGSAVAVNLPGLPEYEKRDATVNPTFGKDTKTETLSPEQIAARDEQHARTEEEIAFTEKEKAQKLKAAAIDQQNADAALFAADAAEQLRTGPAAQKAAEYVTWARKHTRDEENRLAKMPAPALFADREGWGSVRLAVGMGLAGLGDGMMAAAMIRAGHAPSGRSTVSEIIDRDIARQRAAIDKQKDNVLIARTGIADAEEARRAVMADLDLKAKHMYKQAELLTRSRLAALKLDQATIDQTKEVLDLKRKQADHDAAYVANHSTTVTNRYDSAKTTTETINRVPSASQEGKVPGQQAALARQALAELDKLDAGPLPSNATLKKVQDNALESSAADAAIEGAKPMSGTMSVLGRAADAIPRNRYEGLSERDRITIQTMDRSQQLLMHVMTGAGASVEEAKKKAEAFGWVAGDTPASMKAKIAGAKELAHQFISQGAKPSTTATPDGGTPPKREVPFTPANVVKMKAVATDKNRTRKERDDARAYIEAAAQAGVR